MTHSPSEIKDKVIHDVPHYPKYTTQLLNLANQNSQGTRPRVVGQMSDLIQEFDGKTIDEWIAWYEERHPDAREKACDKIESMVEKLTNAINQIDRELIEMWVKDLVLYKTFVGFRFQEAILEKVADIKNTAYQPATTTNESQGIDGYVGDTPVSIKPHTYKSELRLPEDIAVRMIYYEKTRRGIDIEFDF